MTPSQFQLWKNKQTGTEIVLIQASAPSSDWDSKEWLCLSHSHWRKSTAPEAELLTERCGWEFIRELHDGQFER